MTASDALLRLAEAHGLSTSYTDSRGTSKSVAPEVLAAILEALDVRAADPDTALWTQQRARWSELVEPVAVAPDGRGTLIVRIPDRGRDARIEIDLVDEAGAQRSLPLRLRDTRIVGREVIDGVDFVTRRVRLPALAVGYHAAHVGVRVGAALIEGDTLVLSAPRRSYRPASETPTFGVFAPLYGVHSEQSLGIGNLGDLRRLLRWTRELGGTTVGTLPLLATFHDDPEGVSPYAPISRLAWDELFLDVRALPELTASESARTALHQARAAIDVLRARPRVDYQAVERVLWPVLSGLASHAFEAGSARHAAIEGFKKERPLVDDYARFRAARERLGPAWRAWPVAQRRGALCGDDLDGPTYRTHAYAQFALDEQLAAIAAEARTGGGLGLSLDLPLGTHRAGFDAWRFPEAFADRLDAGAPPDVIATTGQNWHFPPGHPEGLRRSGYRYFIESVRTHLRHAGLLRVDHVMGLHRLYVMPRGGAAVDGTYLHYRPNELWAILAIESHRARSAVFGEDLGTVPPEVHRAMGRHGVGGSWVLQYEARPRAAPRTPSPLAVASLNTHDMPTFEGWIRGLDLDARSALGFLTPTDEPAARIARQRRLAALRRVVNAAEGDHPDGALLQACLTYLGRSPAGLVLVSLADLLRELEPENHPGTTIEHPNWQRRLSLSLEQTATSSAVLALIDVVRAARTARGVRGGRPHA